jgi:hypothetical protein
MYEGGGSALCKNVARLEDYPKARRSRQARVLVRRVGKNRSKGAKVAVEGVSESGSDPWTRLCCNIPASPGLAIVTSDSYLGS